MTTPTRINHGVSLLKRCLLSRRSTRWNVKCAVTSNGTSTSVVKRSFRSNKTSEPSLVPEQSPSRATPTTLLPDQDLLVYHHTPPPANLPSTSTLLPRPPQTSLSRDRSDQFHHHTRTSRTPRTRPSQRPLGCHHHQRHLNTHILPNHHILHQTTRHCNHLQLATTARHHHLLPFHLRDTTTLRHINNTREYQVKVFQRTTTICHAINIHLKSTYHRTPSTSVVGRSLMISLILSGIQDAFDSHSHSIPPNPFDTPLHVVHKKSLTASSLILSMYIAISQPSTSSSTSLSTLHTLFYTDRQCKSSQQHHIHFSLLLHAFFQHQHGLTPTLVHLGS